MEAGARKAAVVIALVVIGVAVALLALQPWATTSSVAPPRATADALEVPPPPSRPGLAAAPLPSKPAAAMTEAASEPEEGPAMSGERPAGGAKEDKFPVKGTLQFASGADVRGDVELTFVLREDPQVWGWSKFNGRDFEIRVPRPGRYEVRYLKIGSHLCSPVPPDFEATEGASIVLVVEDPKPAVLQVLDAATGRPLPEAQAYPYQSQGLDGEPNFEMDRSVVVPWQNMQNEKPFLADADGLIRLPSAWGTTDWYVIAPAKAWAAIEALHRGTEPLPVRLRPGGALRLAIPHWSNLRRPTIEIVQGQGTIPVAVPPPDASGAVRVEGLPAGGLAVTVRRGPRYKDGEVYGTGTAEIRAGDTTDLTVDASMMPAKKPVAVKGTVTVPKAWGLTDAALGLAGKDSWASGSESEPLAALLPDKPTPFAFRPVPPGRYEIHMSETGAHWAIDVTEAETPLDLVVSEPCTGEVRVTDAVTGKAIESGSVFGVGVAQNHADGGESWSVNEAKFDAARGAFVLRAPRGRTRVGAMDVPGHLDGSVEADLTPGTSVKIDLRLTLSATVVVRVLLDGKPYVSAKEYSASVAPVDENQDGGVWEEPGTRTGEMSVEGRAPGPTKVELLYIEGFEHVDPKIVDLRSGETTEVVFVLKRKP